MKWFFLELGTYEKNDAFWFENKKNPWKLLYILPSHERFNEEKAMKNYYKSNQRYRIWIEALHKWETIIIVESKEESLSKRRFNRAVALQ